MRERDNTRGARVEESMAPPLDLTGLRENLVELLGLTDAEAARACEAIAHQWEGGYHFDEWKIPMSLNGYFAPRGAVIRMGRFAPAHPPRVPYVAPCRIQSFDGAVVWESEAE